MSPWHRGVASATLGVAAFLSTAATPGVAAAQAVPAGETGTATVSADSVEMAEVFELRVTVPVPAGSIVYFPDTLPRTPDLESFAPVDWDADRGPNGSATLTLTYPLIPFGTGPIEIPAVDIVTVAAGDDAEGERIPGDSRVGAWSDAPISLRNTRRVVGAAVWVRPPYTAEDVVAGMSPRPPADVMGSSWSWPAVALILVFSTVLGGAVVATTRDWLARRPAHGGGPATARRGDPRQRALADLERLLAAGPHPPEQALELYTSSSDIVRSCVEALHPEWGKELTSSELVTHLGEAGLADDDLRSEMFTAEAVKFGRLRPGAPESEAHLRALRRWVAEGETPR